MSTVIAAFSALCVTIYFNRNQVRIAESQKNIAIDKLKWDSHRERYLIYTEARALISYVLHQREFEKIDNMKIRDLRIKIDEARFFFGPSIQSFLREIDDAAESLLTHLGVRWEISADQSVTDWHAINETLTEDSKRLLTLYSEMPARFESALRLTQLARDC